MSVLSRSDGELVVGDDAEQSRFWRFVVRLPGPDECWIWTGAIADDGYGRFSITRAHRNRIVRPHRYSLAIELGGRIGAETYALHEVCDNPICVRAAAGSLPSGRAHVLAGTQAENLASMGRKGRGGGRNWSARWHGLDRASRAKRARALREAVRNGADSEAIAAALTVTDQPTLF